MDGDLHNERQGDDLSATDDFSMDRPGEDDRSGENASMLEDGHLYFMGCGIYTLTQAD